METIFANCYIQVIPVVQNPNISVFDLRKLAEIAELYIRTFAKKYSTRKHSPTLIFLKKFSLK